MFIVLYESRHMYAYLLTLIMSCGRSHDIIKITTEADGRSMNASSSS